MEAFVFHGIGVGLLFLMNVVIGRAIGAAGYGVYSYALAIAGILAIMVPLGWPTALMRFIAQYMEQQRWDLLRGAVQRAFQITFICAALTSLALLTISYWPGLSQELETSLRYGALILPFLSFVELRRKALQGLQRVKSSIFPEEILLPLLMIGSVYLLSVATASGTLLVYSIAALVVFLVGSFLLWTSMPEQGCAAKPRFETRAWMVIALPMVFGGIGQIVMNRTDVLMLGVMENMETVGLYTAANRVALLNSFALTAASTVAAPMMASAFHAGRIREVRTIVHRTILFTSLITLPLFVVMLGWPSLVMELFGAEFADGGRLLQILALGQFVNTLTGPVGFALLMTGQERLFAWTTAIIALGNVAGNLIVIPTFGAVGAASVTAASISILCIWRYLLWRRTF